MRLFKNTWLPTKFWHASNPVSYPSKDTCQEKCSRAKAIVVELGEDELVWTLKTKAPAHLYHQTTPN